MIRTVFLNEKKILHPNPQFQVPPQVISTEPAWLHCERLLPNEPPVYQVLGLRAPKTAVTGPQARSQGRLRQSAHAITASLAQSQR